MGGTVILDEGEVGVNTTDNSFKIGDGSTPWNGLEYHYPDDLNEDKYLQLLGGNTISGNQGLTGNQTITGNLSVTGATTLTGQTSITGATSVSGTLNLNSHKITNLLTPTEDHEAASKKYVDDTVAGLAWKDAVHLLSTTNVPLGGSTNTLQIDGHETLVQADSGIYRILLTAQTNAIDNGIYVYFDDGTDYDLFRAEDANPVSELIGASVYVQEGTSYGTSSWVQSNYAATDYDDLVWVQFSGASLINAGEGIAKLGNELSVKVTTNRTAIVNDAVDIASNYVGQTSIITVGDIETGTWLADTIDIAHGGTGATTAASALENLGLTATVEELNLSDGLDVMKPLEARFVNLEISASIAENDLEGKAGLDVANTFSEDQTINGYVAANNYTMPVQTEASNNVLLDFTGGTGLHTRSANGSIVITATNYSVGAVKTLFITSDSTSRSLTFPSAWIWLGSKPTSIAASRTGVLTVTSLGTAEANAVASWVAQV